MYAQVLLRDAASAGPPAALSPLATCAACLTASDGEENGGEQTWSAMVSTLRAKWHAEKDLATPRRLTPKGRRRVLRRAANRSSRRGTVRVALHMNVISSLLVGSRTPANAFERCLYKDALARSRVRGAPQPVSEAVLFACGACAARQPRDTNINMCSKALRATALRS